MQSLHSTLKSRILYLHFPAQSRTRREPLNGAFGCIREIAALLVCRLLPKAGNSGNSVAAKVPLQPADFPRRGRFFSAAPKRAILPSPGLLAESTSPRTILSALQLVLRESAFPSLSPSRLSSFPMRRRVETGTLYKEGDWHGV